MPLLCDAPPQTAIVYLVDDAGTPWGVRQRGPAFTTLFWYGDCILELPLETRDPEHYAPAGHLGVRVCPSNKQGGVPTRFLGSGTGGMAGR